MQSVNSIDPITGKTIYLHLISLREHERRRQLKPKGLCEASRKVLLEVSMFEKSFRGRSDARRLDTSKGRV